MEGKDRTTIALPQGQLDLLSRVHEALAHAGSAVPVVGVLMHGGALALREVWQHTHALLDTNYLGAKGGAAVADVLLGKVSPSGRLPYTVYDSDRSLPMSMALETPYPVVGVSRGYTYRYFTGIPFLPFGYGLSYAGPAEYSDIRDLPKKVHPCSGSFSLRVRVRNTHATWDGSETVLLFAVKRGSTVPAPRIVLAAFEKVHLRAGEAIDVELTVQLSSIAVVHERGDNAWDAIRVIEEGPIDIYVGGNPQVRRRKSESVSRPPTRFRALIVD